MKNIHILPTDKPSRLYKSKITQGVFISDNMSQHGDATYNVNIYITSDEEIKEGDYFLYDETEIRYKTNGTEYHGRDLCHISGNRRYPVNKSKKIILTTDQNLDGVQKIDDEFLQWFVKNPSCEEVAVGIWSNLAKDGYLYHIIIPKEEQKQHIIDIMRGDEELGLYEEPKQTDEKGSSITFWGGLEESKYIMGIDPYDKQEIVKDLAYWKANAEEDYMKVPISVLRYISELEKQKYSEEEVLKLLIYSKDRFGGGSLENYVSDSEVKNWFEQLKKK